MATFAGFVRSFFLLAVLALGSLSSSSAAEEKEGDAAICDLCRLSSTSDEAAGSCSTLSEQECPAFNAAAHQPPGRDTTNPDDTTIDPDDYDEDEFLVDVTGGDDDLCVDLGDEARRCPRLKLASIICNVDAVVRGGACSTPRTGHRCHQVFPRGQAEQEDGFASDGYYGSDSDWDSESDLEEGEGECFPGVAAKYCQPGVEEDYLLFGLPRIPAGK